jgi:hypothetical protein
MMVYPYVRVVWVVKEGLLVDVEQIQIEQAVLDEYYQRLDT